VEDRRLLISVELEIDEVEEEVAGLDRDCVVKDSIVEF
jgi:hypothetical protein